MNGVHDMGGTEGFGPIDPEPEQEEPVFHAEWEGRVYGMNRALGALGLWNIDKGRYVKERQKPTDYLRRSYYEKWLAGIEALLLEAGVVTEEELRTGKNSSAVPQEIKDKALKAESVQIPIRVANYMPEVATPPRFKPGDRVRTINQHPSGHTREPRYLRGRLGTIRAYYGAQVFPDLSTQGIDEGRHLYSVRFDASELWGESATPRGAVYADLWEPYLEPAE